MRLRKILDYLSIFGEPTDCFIYGVTLASGGGFARDYNSPEFFPFLAISVTTAVGGVLKYRRILLSCEKEEFIGEITQYPSDRRLAEIYSRLVGRREDFKKGFVDYLT